MSFIGTEERGKVAIITINNPPMNVLAMEVLQELREAINKMEKGKAKSVVLRGEGRTFCAGANIKQMVELDKKRAMKFGELGQSVMFSIEQSSKVYIACIHGHAMGGGCELALACDFRVAEKNSIIGQPEIKIGIITGFGGTQRLPNIVGLGRAKDLLLTGRSISGEEAFNIGLVARLADNGKAMDESLKLAEELAAMPGIALTVTKEMTNSFHKRAFSKEKKAFAECFETHDQKEGMRAFLEKRRPNFTDN